MLYCNGAWDLIRPCNANPFGDWLVTTKEDHVLEKKGQQPKTKNICKQ
jgi:hypothetical protein